MNLLDTAQTKRRPRLRATEGEWWRFSLYEIRDGCIRPAKGANLEWYDPWPDFGHTRSQTVGQAPAGAQPGYQSLLKLVHQLEYLPQQARYPDCLTQNSQTLILEWCRQHGPLGVLLSRWESISVAPQQDTRGRWEQWRYSRGFGQVPAVQITRGDVEEATASVLIHTLDDLTFVEEPPRKTWSRFFPGIESLKRDTFPYPRPYTLEFCHLYGEPLMDFCKAAKLLVGAISHLGRTQLPIKGDPNLACKQALDTINVLRRGIASVADFEESGSVKDRRVAPSLLASFADMFVEDMRYGRTTLQCVCCGTLFLSSAYQARYCSVTCRLKEQKRRLRAQMKQAKVLRAQGQTLRQIAASVRQPLEIIKGWLERTKEKAASNAGQGVKRIKRR